MRGPSVAVFAHFTRALARACAPHLAQVVWRLKGALLLFLYDTMPFYGVYEVSFLNDDGDKCFYIGYSVDTVQRESDYRAGNKWPQHAPKNGPKTSSLYEPIFWARVGSQTVSVSLAFAPSISVYR